MDVQSAEGAQKVPRYSINDLKNATDDALVPYLCKLPSPYTFKQSHYYTNIRLAVGYSAVVIAAATFYFDWKLGWNATKDYTAVACVLYFVLNGFLTLWIWNYEAGKLTLQSSVKKHIPIYRLKVRYEAPSGKVWEDKEVEGRFAEWFNEDGYLQQAELRKWLARNVEVIGKADPPSKEVVDEEPPRHTIESASEPARSSGLEAQGGAKHAKKGKRKA